jgi:NAD(P)-dependent dehydrogenase (short-subunit alcohol dehydrogenase family)
MDFTGKTAVITGAASGIGLGLAREGARRGLRLILADRDAAALAAAADGIDGAIAVPTDVTDAAAVAALADRAFAEFGRVDLLFNNAGIMATGFTWEIDPKRWDASLAVNVGGVLNGLRAFVPRMIDQGGPSRIVNTASVGGFSPSPLMSPYSATKFAVVAITEALKAELDMLGAPVGVSLLAPGPVRSAIFDDPFASTTIHPATEGFVNTLRAMIAEHGMDPEPFAAAVFDTIARGDYWIFPQPEAIDPMLERRTRMILDRSEPDFSLG